MKTIGSRLTLLYLLAVGCTMAVVFLLGRHLVETHLVASVDATLVAKFNEISDRFQVDADINSLEAVLFYELGVRTSPVRISVEDLWKDPAYKAARTAGSAPPPPPPARFYTATSPDGAINRIYESTTDSLRVRLSISLESTHAAVSEFTGMGLLVMAVVFAISTLAGAALSRAALHPIRAIERTATRISSSNLSERIPVGEVQDEISNLSRLLNQTFERLEQSFEQISHFAADASHELKTPLSLVRLNLERAVLRGELPPSEQEAMHDSIEEINHLDRLIENLLFLSRAEAGEVLLNRSEVEIAQFVDAFVHDASILAESAGTYFSVGRKDIGTIAIDDGRVRQILLNILSNAVKATNLGGQIVMASVLNSDSWTVSITDEGPGIPEEKLESVFNRFVRIDDPKPDSHFSIKGTGLGLAISKSIAELHGGRLVAKNRSDKSGLIVELVLPISADDPK